LVNLSSSASEKTGQEFAGNGRFPDTIGTGNDIKIRFERCHHAYPIGQPPWATTASSTVAILAGARWWQ